MPVKYKIGVFDEEEKLISSMKTLLNKGYTIDDVYTPYPLHEVLHLLKRKSKLPTAAYLYGLSGALAVLAFLYYTSVIDWPIVYGGKPFNSFPSFIIITIVLTIFIVTIMSLATFSARGRLIPGEVNRIYEERATDDRFAIVVSATQNNEGLFNDAGKLLSEGGAVEVVEKTYETEDSLK
jgi:hypothetical protein